MKVVSYPFKATINGHEVVEILIGQHYREKHGDYMSDELILELAICLDGKKFPADSSTDGIDYYVADIEYGDPPKIYRLVWPFEWELLQILGVINAYRRKRKVKSEV